MSLLRFSCSKLRPLYPRFAAIEIIFCLTSVLNPDLLFSAKETAAGETSASLAISIIRGYILYFSR